MSEPFLGELKIVAFNFAPRGWAFCDGQILPISQNQSLYSLLGTMYGGDGRTAFALPDLRGRAAVHAGPTITQGQKPGQETHTLTTGEIPAHTHTAKGSTAGATTGSPAGGYLAAAVNVYGSPAGTTLEPSTLGPAGGGAAHNNMQPSLVLRYCIALQGLFPSRN
jgi:microcystin-dependent protein